MGDKTNSKTSTTGQESPRPAKIKLTNTIRPYRRGTDFIHPFFHPVINHAVRMPSFMSSFMSSFGWQDHGTVKITRIIASPFFIVTITPFFIHDLDATGDNA